MEAEIGKKSACDNCKARKTKCDRGHPCSSCVAANLNCRSTRRAPEKRQRVLLSSRYDEAMVNVDRSLQDISHLLQTLLRNSEPSLQQPRGSSAASIRSHPTTLGTVSEGYRGDSSFTAHVEQVTDALKDATTNFKFDVPGTGLAETISATQNIQEAANSSISNANSSHSFKVQYPELESKPLPPSALALKLLRLAQDEKQRFFIDVPVIDEHQLAQVCQKIYFAISDYSLSEWVIANAGLFYLFLGLGPQSRAKVGVDSTDIQTNSELLSANLEAAIQALRLCQNPSVEACQALALLSIFCMKSGDSAIAWSLIASASRMCMDLGWHRLPRDVEPSLTSQERKIFWWVYIIDKGMALTLGRTPSIPQYDVATQRPTHLRGLSSATEHLYTGWLEFAIIVGDMHIQLFAAAAQREPPEIHVERAKSFAARLSQINYNLKQSLREHPPVHAMFQDASVLFDIIMHCLTTVVYRMIPCDDPDPHPLKCNAGCVEAARLALATIVQARQTLGQRNPGGWQMFLNMLFCLVPFASFIVLAGNTIATSSTEDLALLAGTISAIEPVAASSRSGKKLYDICRAFHQFASFSVAWQTAVPDPPTIATAQVSDLPADLAIVDEARDPSYGRIMTPQDWATAMDEFELGTGAEAIASFIEPYMLFDGR